MLTQYYLEAGVAIGALDSVCVTVWRLDATPARFAHQCDALRSLARRFPRRVAFMSVIEPSSRPPGDSVRSTALALLSDLSSDLCGVAFVIEGTGFEAAIARSVLSGMRLLLRDFRKEDITFCASVADGAGFLTRRAPWLDAAALQGAAKDLRARLRPLS